ncbi:MAG: hypothetical protein HWE25_05285 [Alphaproteobacteria bacterium]|nr:hypothetical protein [Alphaproteobacteria bacterium]
MTSSKVKLLASVAALTLGLGGLTPGVLSQNQAPLVVQAAQQANFSRLAIAIPEAVGYNLEQQGTSLTLLVQADMQFDLSGVSGGQLRQVANPRVSGSAGQTLISFNVPADAEVRGFRSGQYLVIDVYSDNAASSADTAAGNMPIPAQQQGTAETGQAEGAVNDSAAAIPPSEAPTGDDTVSNADTSEQGDGEGNAEDAGVVQPTADAAAPSGDVPDAETGPLNRQPVQDEEAGSPANGSNVTDVNEQAGQQDDTPRNGSVVISGAKAEGEPVPVSVSTIENGIQMRFSTPEGVAAAAFERGGFLWLVFDRMLGLQPDGLRTQNAIVAPRIRNFEILPHPDALVVRLDIRANQSSVVEKDRNDWLVSLKDTPAKPRFPLVPERKADATRGQQIHIPATDLGRKVEVEDPAVGDLLVVVPTLLEGRGLSQDYTYATSEVLETAQGIVVIPLSDFVNVERFADGVSIMSGGNNILSASQLSRGTGIGGQVAGNFNRLIDFRAWRIGNEWEYRKNKSRLLYELSLKPADDRNDVRWKLARYYLAHGRGAEALGVMNRMMDEDPLLAENSEYLAVRGVSNFKAGRLDQAAADLSARGLEAEQDAELWRALVAEARGKYNEALEHYRRGRDVMGTYDDFDRAEIQLAVVRASIDVGNIEQAQRELDLLNGLKLSSEQLSESVFQSARIAEIQGQMDVAFAQYDDLADAPQHWISARARLARARYNLRTGDITPEQAIDELERLRYAWRGDRFEVALIDDLSKLYFQTAQYASGLEILRQGVGYFPELAQERGMRTRQSQVFRQLFLDGDADRMSPISAISLYYDFRELTPLGNDGDLMIRRLAQRLVSVDLLGRAAELLEYQVRSRLEGAQRALIAAQLAKIYILDEKSEEALQILRATREPRLPADIEATRRYVESRALTEMKRFEEAEVVLDGDRSAEADMLRADIYWGDKKWTRLASVVRRVLGDGWRRNEPLNDMQRLNLIRLTIALTFTEDRAGLIEARRRYGLQMRQGDFANAFELLTNDQELSGRELGVIASQIASVEKLQSFMRDYRSDFSGR